MKLEYGKGRWLELLKGKPVLKQVVNGFCEVRDRRGRFVQGTERLIQVAKQLVKLPLENQPQDLQQLCELIKKRITSRPS